MSTNADKLQSLINATPYHWPTNKLAKEIGITTGSAHRACTTLEKYGLVKREQALIDRRYMSVWFRVGRA